MKAPTLYLYLTHPEWANSWINGGTVPLNLASSYLSSSREGTRTPDENLIHDAPMDLRKHPVLRALGVNVEARNISLYGNFVNGYPAPDVFNAKLYREDGIVLCLSTARSMALARRLGKEACVQILNVKKLRRELDSQIGVKGQMGMCRYTTDHKRGHFLKSIEDSWQCEFRLFWRVARATEVTIGPGTATWVTLENET